MYDAVIKIKTLCGASSVESIYDRIRSTIDTVYRLDDIYKKSGRDFRILADLFIYLGEEEILSMDIEDLLEKMDQE